MYRNSFQVTRMATKDVIQFNFVNTKYIDSAHNLAKTFRIPLFCPWDMERTKVIGEFSPALGK